MVFADIPDLAGTNNMTILAGIQTSADYQNFSEGIFVSQENITFDRSATNGWTISTWYKIDPFVSVFIIGDTNSGSTDYFDIYSDAQNFIDGTLYSERPDIHFNNLSSLFDNNFHNLVIVKDGYNYSFYIDNIFIDSQIYSTPTENLTGLFLLGTDAVGDTDLSATGGFMKQIAVYNKPLSLSEISQNYINGENSYTSTDGLVHYWSFTTFNQQQQQISQNYLSSPIYQVMASSGAGLGIFIHILGQALPLLLIGLAFVGILIVIGFAIKKYLIEGGSP